MLSRDQVLHVARLARLELTDDGLAVVSEVIPAISLSTLLTKTMSFPVTHFSGYIAASGRAVDSDGAY